MAGRSKWREVSLMFCGAPVPSDLDWAQACEQTGMQDGCRIDAVTSAAGAACDPVVWKGPAGMPLDSEAGKIDDKTREPVLSESAPMVCGIL